MFNDTVYVDVAKTNSTGHGTRPPRYNYYASRYSVALTLFAVSSLAIVHISHCARLPSGKRWKYWSVLGVTQRNVLYLYRLPTWLYGPETVIELLWTILYCGIFCFFGLNKTELMGGDQNTANQIGVLAFSQLPIIIILIMKNNPISLVTGITYQKLNFLHRASSRACLVFSWAHVILWLIPVWDAGHIVHAYILWGYLAIIGFTILWVTSFRVIRRVAYEFFLAAHIVGTLMFLIGAFFHWQRLGYWVWPALAFWVLDRFARGIKVLRCNIPLSQAGAVAEIVGPHVLRISVRRKGFKWNAGQHLFLSAPSISDMPHESHPFSIANIPTADDNEVILVVRIHKGFTQRLKDAMGSDAIKALPLSIEGPYGASHSLLSYDTVCLLAGGTGVTYTSAFLLDIINQPGKSQVRSLRLVWHIQHTKDAIWLATLLNDAAERISGDLEVSIDVYVTRSDVSKEPNFPDGLTDSLVHGFAPRMLPPQTPDVGTGANTPSLTAPSTPLWEGNRAYGLDALQERFEHVPLLPKTRLLQHRQDLGFSVRSLSLIRWHTGRANLEEIIKMDADACTGKMHVSVCGPTQLSHAARRAVAQVNTPAAIMSGQCSIEYYEETLA